MQRAAFALTWGLLCAIVTPVFAQAVSQSSNLPSFAELEAAGARIGEIRILNLDIFDLQDPQEDNALFRLANKLHIKTRPGVIERQLLFKSGDRLSQRVMEETERMLRTNRYFYDVKLRPASYRDGVADVEVLTRDTWSLDPGVTFGRSGGTNSSSISLKEYNLLGTGISVGYGRVNNVDRSGNEFHAQYNHAFDGWTSLSYSLADNSDGKRQTAAVVRPFYSLDTRWAAGVTVSQDNRIDSIYSAGTIASQYRHRQDNAEAFAGWSNGLVDGWTKRYSIGISSRDDNYQLEPGLVAPGQLPSGQKTVAPFIRFEVIEDDFQKLSNRNQIGRPEFFAKGLAGSVQIGRALTSLGSSQDWWVYSGSVSKGFNPVADHDLFASASVAGQYGDGQVRRQLLSTALRYYLPLNKRYLLYGSISADTLTNPDSTDFLTLGGDNGLRGYPLRYRSGDRRTLLTLEARGYTDLYLYRLFRVGGAVFYDIGRAWGGPSANTANAQWMSNVGVGLRIFSVRSAFSNVLHLDIAVPLNRDAGVKPVQFLVKTKTSF